MRMIPIEPLETERLLLRKLAMEDVEPFYHRLGGSVAVTKYMLWIPHKSLEESAASIQKTLQRYAAGNCYRWGIVRKQDGALIGMIDLLAFQEADNSCSFAYMLGEEFWNQGYGTEALRAVFAFAFQKLQVSVICADHFAENGASGSVMRKVGMVFQETIPEKYEKNGIRYDANVYRITKEMWSAHEV